MAVAGLRGTGDWGTDERPKNFREMILWLNPNGTAPITALTARVRKEVTTDPEFSWWAEPNDLVRLQVNEAGGYGTSDTLITVDSTDPTASVLDSRYGSALNLVPGDLLMVEPTADSATFTYEQLRVTAVHSATQFSVERGFAGTTPANIPDNAFLLKVGTSFAEGTGAPLSATRNPVKYNNYTQIFKTTYEITRTAANTRLRTGDPLRNDRRRAAFFHAKDIETAILFGQKSEVIGSNGKPQRTTAGLRAFLPAGILQNGWTIANPTTSGNSLLDQISPVFDWDSEAGDERIAFCGNGALNAINAAIHKASGVGATTIRFGSSEKVYGMNFTRVTFPQGSVLLKTHPLLNRHPLYNYSMFILDFSAIRWRPLKNSDTKVQDNIQNKGEDLIRGQWLTEAGIEVNNGGLTMKYIGGFNATIG